jgi:pilus assembly protein CpaF
MSMSVRNRVHNDVVHRLRETTSTPIKEVVSSSIQREFPLLSPNDSAQLTTDVVQQIQGYGFLEVFLDDPEINEIMINSPHDSFVERNGIIQRIELDVTSDDLINVAQRIASAVGQRCDIAHPIVDAWLSNGARVNAILNPIAADGPCMTIRKFSSQNFSIDDFCSGDAERDVLKDLIATSHNIVVAGGTSSGKTSLLSSCMNEVPTNERIVSIEETAEIACKHPHVVRLVARASNGEGRGEVSLRDLVKTSLRMRPDRIVVGEVRSAESFDLIQALNTGHGGSMCTIHANGPQEVLHRMASLAVFAHTGLQYDAILTQATFGVQAIVFVERNKTGQRYISQIARVLVQNKGFELTPLFSCVEGDA